MIPLILGVLTGIATILTSLAAALNWIYIRSKAVGRRDAEMRAMEMRHERLRTELSAALTLSLQHEGRSLEFDISDPTIAEQILKDLAERVEASGRGEEVVASGESPSANSPHSDESGSKEE